jgi:hypothetical protein
MYWGLDMTVMGLMGRECNSEDVLGVSANMLEPMERQFRSAYACEV